MFEYRQTCEQLVCIEYRWCIRIDLRHFFLNIVITYLNSSKKYLETIKGDQLFVQISIGFATRQYTIVLHSYANRDARGPEMQPHGIFRQKICVIRVIEIDGSERVYVIVRARKFLSSYSRTLFFSSIHASGTLLWGCGKNENTLSSPV